MPTRTTTRQGRRFAPTLASGALIALTVPLIGLTVAGTSALAPLDDKLTRELKSVFPDATSFAARTGELPHFRVYQRDPDQGEPRLLGFAYFTTDIEKLEKGYKAPINFLVGMTVEGQITGVKLVEHDEPYGYFSIETASFHAQFTGKSILDRFRVGRDIDAISSATITIASASRGIRNSGRRIARQYLAESDAS